jgi:hypothetical protein
MVSHCSPHHAHGTGTGDFANSTAKINANRNEVRNKKRSEIFIG